MSFYPHFWPPFFFPNWKHSPLKGHFPIKQSEADYKYSVQVRTGGKVLQTCVNSLCIMESGIINTLSLHSVSTSQPKLTHISIHRKWPHSISETRKAAWQFKFEIERQEVIYFIKHCSWCKCYLITNCEPKEWRKREITFSELTLVTIWLLMKRPSLRA